MATGAAPQQPSNSPTRLPIPNSPGAFRIGGLTDPTRKQYLKMLVYAGPGAGKTTLFGSAVDVPQLRDVLLITAEGGTAVLEDNDRVDNPEFCDAVKVDRIEQFQKIYDFLRSHCSMREAGNLDGLEGLQRLTFGIPEDEPIVREGEGDDRLRQYHTVIIDSLTEIEAQCLAKILNLDAVGFDAGEDMEVAGFPQFRKNNHIIQRIVRQFRDLPLHVFIVCSQAYSQDERKVFHYTPALTGKLSTQVQGFMDIVGWLVVGQPEKEDQPAPRRLFVQPLSVPVKADAKNRLSSYKKTFFENPTLQNILEQTGFISKIGR